MRSTRVLLVASLTFTLAGCGGGDDDESQARATPSRTQSSERSLAPSRTPKAQPSESPENDATATAISELEQYLSDNFTGTSWYGHVKEVRPFVGTVVEVQTDLFPDSDAEPIAMSICAGVSSFVFSNDQTVLSGVRVAASTGESLVLRKSLSESCRP